MKTAKLFKNGQSQAVRLPKEFRFTGDKVYVKKQGDNVVLTPMQAAWWEPLVTSLDMFSADFMAARDQPEQQERDFFE